MARIFITGAADGLGQLAAKALITQGHQVVLHARADQRAKEALDKVPGAEAVLTGDLASITETIRLAGKVNALGKFDAVIHNAGVYHASGEELLAVNTLAPYILTCLIEKPGRLIYLSSGMHEGGRSKLDRFKTGVSGINYSDTKLHVLMLCQAVARKWTDVYANTLNPGWVPTKMGGPGAPDSFEDGYETQVWLAVSDDERAKVSGCFFYHKKETHSNPEADNVPLQEDFLALCEELTGVQFPYKS
ncbi:SDR family NAD(P)-dependent oxidoreductase [Pedobacter sp. SYSU D00535]|uniref:SDR family NAD(P)-dependent oxidoreductase n=1 Tax=Pedobacter sp. SYSU D00535 TaxID=2810308 RepID=UPI001A96255F|nr:SDR family NAD(P)-dependent oxidoreductase [Pedobacter sp. SYSU D00535]